MIHHEYQITDHKSQMVRVDFSRNAPFYDRRHGAIAGDVLEEVARVAGLHPTAHTTRGGDPGLERGAAVLEVGAGTGRERGPGRGRLSRGGHRAGAPDAGVPAAESNGPEHRGRGWRGSSPAVSRYF